MKRIVGDTLGGRGITWIPQSEDYTSVVFWMHGLGDTADGWASMMPSLGLEKTKFILPTASIRPVTLSGGMSMPAWSDVFGLDATFPEDSQGFEESADRINQIIQVEVDKGIDPSRIIVAGFSQGGALALHIALRSIHSLGGVIALSTWLPMRDDYPAALSSSAASSLKILQVHGDADQVVSFEWGEGTHRLLKTLITRTEPVFLKIRGMGHSSDEEETLAVRRFLLETLK